MGIHRIYVVSRTTFQVVRTGRLRHGSLVTARIGFAGEVLAGADGLGGGEVGVGPHAARRDVVALAEVGDKRLGRGDLPRRRRLLVEVADQADADAVFVDVVGAGVAAVDALLLIGPALGDLDLAVGAAGAVADHEVIAAAVDSPGSCGARRRSGRSCRWPTAL